VARKPHWPNSHIPIIPFINTWRLVWNQSEEPAALEEWTEGVLIARYRFAGFGLQPLLLYLFCILGMGLATSL